MNGSIRTGYLQSTLMNLLNVGGIKGEKYGIIGIPGSCERILC